jgi:hypothetical protein
MSARYLSGTLLLALIACTSKSGTPPPGNQSVTNDSAPAPQPAAMELKAKPMLRGFRAHLDTLAHSTRMRPAVMSQHMAEVKNLVEAIHSDMRAMGMPSDAAYEALADSVVRGSEALGTAGGADFKRRLSRHMDQLHRLTSVYETKIAAMR